MGLSQSKQIHPRDSYSLSHLEASSSFYDPSGNLSEQDDTADVFFDTSLLDKYLLDIQNQSSLSFNLPQSHIDLYRLNVKLMSKAENVFHRLSFQLHELSIHQKQFQAINSSYFRHLESEYFNLRFKMISSGPSRKNVFLARKFLSFQREDRTNIVKYAELLDEDDDIDEKEKNDEENNIMNSMKKDLVDVESFLDEEQSFYEQDNLNSNQAFINDTQIDFLLTELDDLEYGDVDQQYVKALRIHRHISTSLLKTIEKLELKYNNPSQAQSNFNLSGLCQQLKAHPDDDHFFYYNSTLYRENSSYRQFSDHFQNILYDRIYSLYKKIASSFKKRMHYYHSNLEKKKKIILQYKYNTTSGRRGSGSVSNSNTNTSSSSGMINSERKFSKPQLFLNTMNSSNSAFDLHSPINCSPFNTAGGFFSLSLDTSDSVPLNNSCSNALPVSETEMLYYIKQQHNKLMLTKEKLHRLRLALIFLTNFKQQYHHRFQENDRELHNLFCDENGQITIPYHFDSNLTLFKSDGSSAMSYDEKNKTNIAQNEYILKDEKLLKNSPSKFSFRSHTHHVFNPTYHDDIFQSVLQSKLGMNAFFLFIKSVIQEKKILKVKHMRANKLTPPLAQKLNQQNYKCLILALAGYHYELEELFSHQNLRKKQDNSKSKNFLQMKKVQEDIVKHKQQIRSHLSAIELHREDERWWGRFDQYKLRVHQQYYQQVHLHLDKQDHSDLHSDKSNPLKNFKFNNSSAMPPPPPSPQLFYEALLRFYVDINEQITTIMMILNDVHINDTTSSSKMTFAQQSKIFKLFHFVEHLYLYAESLDRFLRYSRSEDFHLDRDIDFQPCFRHQINGTPSLFCSCLLHQNQQMKDRQKREMRASDAKSKNLFQATAQTNSFSNSYDSKSNLLPTYLLTPQLIPGDADTFLKKRKDNLLTVSFKHIFETCDYEILYGSHKQHFNLDYEGCGCPRCASNMNDIKSFKEDEETGNSSSGSSKVPRYILYLNRLRHFYLHHHRFLHHHDVRVSMMMYKKLKIKLDYEQDSDLGPSPINQVPGFMNMFQSQINDMFECKDSRDIKFPTVPSMPDIRPNTTLPDEDDDILEEGDAHYNHSLFPKKLLFEFRLLHRFSFLYQQYVSQLDMDSDKKHCDSELSSYSLCTFTLSILLSIYQSISHHILLHFQVEHPIRGDGKADDDEEQDLTDISIEDHFSHTQVCHHPEPLDFEFPNSLFHSALRTPISEAYNSSLTHVLNNLINIPSIRFNTITHCLSLSSHGQCLDANRDPFLNSLNNIMNINQVLANGYSINSPSSATAAATSSLNSAGASSPSSSIDRERENALNNMDKNSNSPNLDKMKISPLMASPNYSTLSGSSNIRTFHLAFLLSTQYHRWVASEVGHGVASSSQDVYEQLLKHIGGTLMKDSVDSSQEVLAFQAEINNDLKLHNEKVYSTIIDPESNCNSDSDAASISKNGEGNNRYLADSSTLLEKQEIELIRQQKELQIEQQKISLQLKEAEAEAKKEQEINELNNKVQILNSEITDDYSAISTDIVPIAVAVNPVNPHKHSINNPTPPSINNSFFNEEDDSISISLDFNMEDFSINHTMDDSMSEDFMAVPKVPKKNMTIERTISTVQEKVNEDSFSEDNIKFLSNGSNSNSATTLNPPLSSQFSDVNNGSVSRLDLPIVINVPPLKLPHKINFSPTSTLIEDVIQKLYFDQLGSFFKSINLSLNDSLFFKTPSSLPLPEDFLKNSEDFLNKDGFRINNLDKNNQLMINNIRSVIKKILRKQENKNDWVKNVTLCSYDNYYNIYNPPNYQSFSKDNLKVPIEDDKSTILKRSSINNLNIYSPIPSNKNTYFSDFDASRSNSKDFVSPIKDSVSLEVDKEKSCEQTICNSKSSDSSVENQIQTIDIMDSYPSDIPSPSVLRNKSSLSSSSLVSAGSNTIINFLQKKRFEQHRLSFLKQRQELTLQHQELLKTHQDFIQQQYIFSQKHHHHYIYNYILKQEIQKQLNSRHIHWLFSSKNSLFLLCKDYSMLSFLHLLHNDHHHLLHLQLQQNLIKSHQNLLQKQVQHRLQQQNLITAQSQPAQPQNNSRFSFKKNMSSSDIDIPTRSISNINSSISKINSSISNLKINIQQDSTAGPHLPSHYLAISKALNTLQDPPYSHHHSKSWLSSLLVMAESLSLGVILVDMRKKYVRDNRSDVKLKEAELLKGIGSSYYSNIFSNPANPPINSTINPQSNSTHFSKLSSSTDSRLNTEDEDKNEYLGYPIIYTNRYCETLFHLHSSDLVGKCCLNFYKDRLISSVSGGFNLPNVNTSWMTREDFPNEADLTVPSSIIMQEYLNQHLVLILNESNLKESKKYRDDDHKQRLKAFISSLDAQTGSRNRFISYSSSSSFFSINSSYVSSNNSSQADFQPVNTSNPDVNNPPPDQGNPSFFSFLKKLTKPVSAPQSNTTNNVSSSISVSSVPSNSGSTNSITNIPSIPCNSVKPLRYHHEDHYLYDHILQFYHLGSLNNRDQLISEVKIRNDEKIGISDNNDDILKKKKLKKLSEINITNLADIGENFKLSSSASTSMDGLSSTNDGDQDRDTESESDTNFKFAYDDLFSAGEDEHLDFLNDLNLAENDEQLDTEMINEDDLVVEDLDLSLSDSDSKYVEDYNTKTTISNSLILSDDDDNDGNDDQESYITDSPKVLSPSQHFFDRQQSQILSSSNMYANYSHESTKIEEDDINEYCEIMKHNITLREKFHFLDFIHHHQRLSILMLNDIFRSYDPSFDPLSLSQHQTLFTEVKDHMGVNILYLPFYIGSHNSVNMKQSSFEKTSNISNWLYSQNENQRLHLIGYKYIFNSKGVRRYMLSLHIDVSNYCQLFVSKMKLKLLLLKKKVMVMMKKKLQLILLKDVKLKLKMKLMKKKKNLKTNIKSRSSNQVSTGPKDEKNQNVMIVKETDRAIFIYGDKSYNDEDENKHQKEPTESTTFKTYMKPKGRYINNRMQKSSKNNARNVFMMIIKKKQKLLQPNSSDWKEDKAALAKKVKKMMKKMNDKQILNSSSIYSSHSDSLESHYASKGIQPTVLDLNSNLRNADSKSSMDIKTEETIIEDANLSINPDKARPPINRKKSTSSRANPFEPKKEKTVDPNSTRFLSYNSSISPQLYESLTQLEKSCFLPSFLKYKMKMMKMKMVIVLMKKKMLNASENMLIEALKALPSITLLDDDDIHLTPEVSPEMSKDNNTENDPCNCTIC